MSARRSDAMRYVMIVWVAALALPACGPMHVNPDTPNRTLELKRALIKADEAFTDQLQARREPDCEGACARSGAVCALSARICALSEHEPADREINDLCQDGQRRCARASKRVAEVCECLER